MQMQAYHNDPLIKLTYLQRVRRHREADDIVAGGVGWSTENGVTGCAVGCTFDAYDHSRGPIEIGVPTILMHLEDSIFEGLAGTGQNYLAFSELFLDSIPVGADLEMVWPRFALWLLSGDDSPIAAHFQIPEITTVANLYGEWLDYVVKPNQDRFLSAAWAASAAAFAAAFAACAAASEAAFAANEAAGAAGAANEAAGAASAASQAAGAASWVAMRDKLLELLATSPFHRHVAETCR